MKFTRNDPILKQHRQELRRSQTDAEKAFWRRVRNRQFLGMRFFRQYSIGPYILDFYCSKLKLVVEIDGESHDGKFSYDMYRQSFLESLGLTVLRFNDADVTRDTISVLMAIEGWIERNNPLTPFNKGEYNHK